jgi:hypothetical protein
MEGSTVDYRNLIQYNLEMMMDGVACSNDPKKQWKIESYRKALDNLPITPIHSNQDLGSARIAGASILNKINWILTHKKNHPEVERYMQEV